MTAFVLVSGPFTGGWLWQEVAARLGESGAEVYPATLTGMGDPRRPAGPGTDLETHIEDLVRLIDEIDAPEVVIVGHDYGIHPVLGAADRRPERIARIVYLDAGMPQDGDAAVALVPDQTIREGLSHQGGQSESDWRIPAPQHDEWQRWGSTDGIPAEALARMDRLAVPQPAGTFTQPLRLSGAGSGLPTTGVLCTANGSSIEMVEFLVTSGPPQFRWLADPRVTFFELATGHWPMLSSPDELAGVLLRAAAGEGHRVTTAPGEQPAHLRTFLLDVEERPRERVGEVDLYLPDPPGAPDAERPRPAVVFVHGGPVAPDERPTPRDWPGYVGYCRYVASLGAIGVMLDHRLHGLADYARAAEDVAAAVERVRADPRVDGDRVALWYFSGGGLLSADPLAEPPPWLRCVAMTYPVLAPLPGWGMVDARFRPVQAVSRAGRLPVVLTRVGLENAAIAATVGEFLSTAEDCKADVEVVDVPLGHHGFETIDHTEEARGAVERAVRAVLGHLMG
ncbi:alpha/beta fold hydrolase [Streptomyces rectiverticillatus]|uniref:alpha/beta hydrolase n=1 Tax=Streptomyces rectiverticillatus TaxID=173860 RepID=UPI0015C39013|nr:alpha/beta fold hydrolase [Streptomyces rectiverticillatus]QLE75092.1 alpha/beta fold hydrolase [Streptomyces rectiverticillatus]